MHEQGGVQFGGRGGCHRGPRPPCRNWAPQALLPGLRSPAPSWQQMSEPLSLPQLPLLLTHTAAGRSQRPPSPVLPLFPSPLLEGPPSPTHLPPSLPLFPRRPTARLRRRARAHLHVRAHVDVLQALVALVHHKVPRVAQVQPRLLLRQLRGGSSRAAGRRV